MLKLAGLNAVRVAVAAPGISDVDTSIPLESAVAPYQEPPDPGADFYYLTLIDYTVRPGAWERVKVTARTGTGPYALTVVRNIASSTGAAISFSAGAVAQWVPGVEEITPRAKFVLSGGGWATSIFRLDPDNTTPQYTLPVNFYDNAGHTDDTGLRWYNITGKTLTISQLFLYTKDPSMVGDLTLTVQVDGVDTSIAVTVLSTDTGPLTKRDTTHKAEIADGSYLVIKATGTAATETGRVYMHRLSLLLEE